MVRIQKIFPNKKATLLKEIKKGEFVKKTRPEIFKEIDTDLKNLYGNFSDCSSLGLLRTVTTDIINELWEDLEEIYNLSKDEK